MNQQHIQQGVFAPPNITTNMINNLTPAVAQPATQVPYIYQPVQAIINGVAQNIYVPVPLMNLPRNVQGNITAQENTGAGASGNPPGPENGPPPSYPLATGNTPVLPPPPSYSLATANKSVGPPPSYPLGHVDKGDNVVSSTTHNIPDRENLNIGKPRTQVQTPETYEQRARKADLLKIPRFKRSWSEEDSKDDSGPPPLINMMPSTRRPFRSNTVDPIQAMRERRDNAMSQPTRNESVERFHGQMDLRTRDTSEHEYTSLRAHTRSSSSVSSRQSTPSPSLQRLTNRSDADISQLMSKMNFPLPQDKMTSNFTEVNTESRFNRFNQNYKEEFLNSIAFDDEIKRRLEAYSTSDINQKNKTMARYAQIFNINESRQKQQNQKQESIHGNDIGNFTSSFDLQQPVRSMKLKDLIEGERKRQIDQTLGRNAHLNQDGEVKDYTTQTPIKSTLIPTPQTGCTVREILKWKARFKDKEEHLEYMPRLLPKRTDKSRLKVEKTTKFIDESLKFHDLSKSHQKREIGKKKSEPAYIPLEELMPRLKSDQLEKKVKMPATSSILQSPVSSIRSPPPTPVFPTAVPKSTEPITMYQPEPPFDINRTLQTCQSGISPFLSLDPSIDEEDGNALGEPVEGIDNDTSLHSISESGECDLKIEAVFSLASLDQSQANVFALPMPSPSTTMVLPKAPRKKRKKRGNTWAKGNFGIAGNANKKHVNIALRRKRRHKMKMKANSPQVIKKYETRSKVSTTSASSGSSTDGEKRERIAIKLKLNQYSHGSEWSVSPTEEKTAPKLKENKSTSEKTLPEIKLKNIEDRRESFQSARSVSMNSISTTDSYEDLGDYIDEEIMRGDSLQVRIARYNSQQLGFNRERNLSENVTCIEPTDCLDESIDDVEKYYREQYTEIKPTESEKYTEKIFEKSKVDLQSSGHITSLNDSTDTNVKLQMDNVVSSDVTATASAIGENEVTSTSDEEKSPVHVTVEQDDPSNGKVAVVTSDKVSESRGEESMISNNITTLDTKGIESVPDIVTSMADDAIEKERMNSYGEVETTNVVNRLKKKLSKKIAREVRSSFYADYLNRTKSKAIVILKRIKRSRSMKHDTVKKLSKEDEIMKLQDEAVSVVSSVLLNDDSEMKETKLIEIVQRISDEDMSVLPNDNGTVGEKKVAETDVEDASGILQQKVEESCSFNELNGENCDDDQERPTNNLKPEETIDSNVENDNVCSSLGCTISENDDKDFQSAEASTDEKPNIEPSKQKLDKKSEEDSIDESVTEEQTHFLPLNAKTQIENLEEHLDMLSDEEYEPLQMDVSKSSDDDFHSTVESIAPESDTSFEAEDRINVDISEMLKETKSDEKSGTRDADDDRTEIILSTDKPLIQTEIPEEMSTEEYSAMSNKYSAKYMSAENRMSLPGEETLSNSSSIVVKDKQTSLLATDDLQCMKYDLAESTETTEKFVEEFGSQRNITSDADTDPEKKMTQPETNQCTKIEIFKENTQQLDTQDDMPTEEVDLQKLIVDVKILSENEDDKTEMVAPLKATSEETDNQNLGSQTEDANSKKKIDDKAVSENTIDKKETEPALCETEFKDTNIDETPIQSVLPSTSENRKEKKHDEIHEEIDVIEKYLTAALETYNSIDPDQSGLSDDSELSARNNSPQMESSKVGQDEHSPNVNDNELIKKCDQEADAKQNATFNEKAAEEICGSASEAVSKKKSPSDEFDVHPMLNTCCSGIIPFLSLNEAAAPVPDTTSKKESKLNEAEDIDNTNIGVGTTSKNVQSTDQSKIDDANVIYVEDTTVAPNQEMEQSKFHDDTDISKVDGKAESPDELKMQTTPSDEVDDDTYISDIADEIWVSLKEAERVRKEAKQKEKEEEAMRKYQPIAPQTSTAINLPYTLYTLPIGINTVGTLTTPVRYIVQSEENARANNLPIISSITSYGFNANPSSILPLISTGISSTMTDDELSLPSSKNTGVDQRNAAVEKTKADADEIYLKDATRDEMKADSVKVKEETTSESGQRTRLTNIQKQLAELNKQGSVSGVGQNFCTSKLAEVEDTSNSETAKVIVRNPADLDGCSNRCKTEAVQPVNVKVEAPEFTGVEDDNNESRFEPVKPVLARVPEPPSVKKELVENFGVKQSLVPLNNIGYLLRKELYANLSLPKWRRYLRRVHPDIHKPQHRELKLDIPKAVHGSPFKKFRSSAVIDMEKKKKQKRAAQMLSRLSTDLVETHVVAGRRLSLTRRDINNEPASGAEGIAVGARRTSLTRRNMSLDDSKEVIQSVARRRSSLTQRDHGSAATEETKEVLKLTDRPQKNCDQSTSVVNVAKPKVKRLNSLSLGCNDYVRRRRRKRKNKKKMPVVPIDEQTVEHAIETAKPTETTINTAEAAQAQDNVSRECDINAVTNVSPVKTPKSKSKKRRIPLDYRNYLKRKRQSEVPLSEVFSGKKLSLLTSSSPRHISSYPAINDGKAAENEVKTKDSPLDVNINDAKTSENEVKNIGSGRNVKSEAMADAKMVDNEKIKIESGRDVDNAPVPQRTLLTHKRCRGRPRKELLHKGYIKQQDEARAKRRNSASPSKISLSEEVKNEGQKGEFSSPSKVQTVWDVRLNAYKSYRSLAGVGNRRSFIRRGRGPRPGSRIPPKNVRNKAAPTLMNSKSVDDANKGESSDSDVPLSEVLSTAKSSLPTSTSRNISLGELAKAVKDNTTNTEEDTRETLNNDKNNDSLSPTDRSKFPLKRSNHTSDARKSKLKRRRLDYTVRESKMQPTDIEEDKSKTEKCDSVSSLSPVRRLRRSFTGRRCRSRGKLTRTATRGSFQLPETVEEEEESSSDSDVPLSKVYSPEKVKIANLTDTKPVNIETEHVESTKSVENNETVSQRMIFNRRRGRTRKRFKVNKMSSKPCLVVDGTQTEGAKRRKLAHPIKKTQAETVPVDEAPLETVSGDKNPDIASSSAPKVLTVWDKRHHAYISCKSRPDAGTVVVDKQLHATDRGRSRGSSKRFSLNIRKNSSAANPLQLNETVSNTLSLQTDKAGVTLESSKVKSESPRRTTSPRRARSPRLLSSPPCSPQSPSLRLPGRFTKKFGHPLSSAQEHLRDEDDQSRWLGVESSVCESDQYFNQTSPLSSPKATRARTSALKTDKPVLSSPIRGKSRGKGRGGDRRTPRADSALKPVALRSIKHENTVSRLRKKLEKQQSVLESIRNTNS